MAKLIKKEEPIIIFSTDPSVKKGPKPKKVAEVVPQEHILKIRLETNKRGGKTASVIFELPDNSRYFKDLTKKLKSLCGSGGSFKEDVIVIQGDHREKLKQYLEKKGFGVKLAGGK